MFEIASKILFFSLISPIEKCNKEFRWKETAPIWIFPFSKFLFGRREINSKTKSNCSLNSSSTLCEVSITKIKSDLQSKLLLSG